LKYSDTKLRNQPWTALKSIVPNGAESIIIDYIVSEFPRLINQNCDPISYKKLIKKCERKGGMLNGSDGIFQKSYGGFTWFKTPKHSATKLMRLRLGNWEGSNDCFDHAIILADGVVCNEN
jgi:hypothetical protein